MNEFGFAVEKLEWEACRCDWCGEEESKLYFEGPDRLERLPGNFRFVRCIRCGIYRQDPRLNWKSLLHYYPEEYVAFNFDNTYAKQSWKNWIKNYGNVKRRKVIERFQYGGILLEIGCGTGAFLMEMKKTCRWNVIGIEPNKKAADFAREITGSTILNSRFSELDLEPESYDGIVLWNVLEHLEHPVRDLKMAHKLLKKNGWLFLSMPNLESLEAAIFRHAWAGWDLPRHLYLFPRVIFKKMMEDIGFIVVGEKCISASYASLGHSINFWSQTWEHKNPRMKRALLRIYYSWMTRVILLLPLAIIDRLKLSSTITVIAEKT